MNKQLKQLVARARTRRMTAKDLEAQQISFAYGNAPKGARTTKDSVRAALRFTSAVKGKR
jgi:hypothetical protein